MPTFYVFQDKKAAVTTEVDGDSVSEAANKQTAADEFKYDVYQAEVSDPQVSDETLTSQEQRSITLTKVNEPGQIAQLFDTYSTTEWYTTKTRKGVGCCSHFEVFDVANDDSTPSPEYITKLDFDNPGDPQRLSLTYQRLLHQNSNATNPL